jgi:dTDP-4-dehydrorhamnose reductase
VTTLRGLTVLVTGAAGQLGRELQRTAPPDLGLRAFDSRALDVTRPEVVHGVLEREHPDLVIHTAAFAAVDAAEGDAERAEAVNAAGAAHVAEAARKIGARLIHISTDYVFDGLQGRPYGPEDRPRPLNVYGRTKLAGEREVRRISGGTALIVRTSWLYSSQGRNFVRRMLQLLSERGEVGVVCDRVGSPTWARALAEALWAAAALELTGTHHWTDDGVASWYDFAVAIREEALALGILSRAGTVRPIRSEEFPATAPRPSYSVLDHRATRDALGLPVRHWRENLRLMLQELAHG